MNYDAEYFANVEWHYYAPSPFVEGQFYTNKLEVLIGFRLTSLEAGTKHHGWLRFTRPNVNFTTSFDLVASDWNPLPDQPIAAGEPPVIPLTHEVTAEGLKLSWPAPVAGWILEASAELGLDAAWEPVPEVNATDITLPPPEGTRFYRLRRP